MRHSVVLVCIILITTVTSTAIAEVRNVFTVSIGMNRHDADSAFRNAKVKLTRPDTQRGYIPRKSLSEPLPPREQLYAISDRTRIDVYIDRDTDKVSKMYLRISPNYSRPRAGRTIPERLFVECTGITFFQDGTYSIRFPPRHFDSKPSFYDPE